MALVQVGKVCLTSLFQSLSLRQNQCLLSTSAVMNVKLTPPSLGMPTKRKKKQDPMVLRNKLLRRRKKLEKAMKKMSKKKRIIKPCLEIVPSQQLIQEAESRTRTVQISEEIQDERSEAAKNWSRFCKKRHVAELKQIDTVIVKQMAALEALREESQELYKMAIAPDATLLPFKAVGPAETPAISDFFQDGEYADTTRQYAIQYADIEAFMKELLAADHRKKVEAKRKKNEAQDDDDD